jgi:hypothetical protein
MGNDWKMRRKLVRTNSWTHIPKDGRRRGIRSPSKYKLTPGSKARKHKSTSKSVGSQPEWSSAWSNFASFPGTKRTKLGPQPSPEAVV